MRRLGKTSRYRDKKAFRASAGKTLSVNLPNITMRGGIRF